MLRKFSRGLLTITSREAASHEPRERDLSQVADPPRRKEGDGDPLGQSYEPGDWERLLHDVYC